MWFGKGSESRQRQLWPKHNWLGDVEKRIGLPGGKGQIAIEPYHI